MNRRGQKGSITVFLSLACILFLCLVCAVTESARIQGAKTQTANITGMGTFSLLGEFEINLLEEYDIFSLDGTYGSGSFQINKVNERLQNFMSYNANPKKDIFSLMCFDPWNLELESSNIKEYALLTDQEGESFYQQSVSYMKDNIAVIALDKLLEYTKNLKEIESGQTQYQNSRSSNDNQLSILEGQKQQKLSELEETAREQQNADSSDSGQETTAVTVQTKPKVANPLISIAKLKRKSVLDIVTWDKVVSDKKINPKNFPSKGTKQKGNMEIEKKHSGLVSNVLFREYLMMKFPSYVTSSSGKVLDYQIEYILGGKNTDKKNLKYVVNRLLLIREGMNYLYCLSDPAINSEADSLAVALTGFIGIPALTVATKHALLLAWAYAESLIDVRILLDSGKVPLYKDASTWALPLEKLGMVEQILRQGNTGGGKGLSYEEYLRILLNLGRVSSQRMRGLDMIQAQMQKNGDDYSFKADHCIVALKASTKWNCKPVFAGLPKAIMGSNAGNLQFAQESSMAY